MKNVQNNLKTYYSIAEVAGILDVHPTTIRRAIDDGDLPATKIRWVWRIHKDDLERYLANNRG